ncbi:MULTISPECIES: putative quinol monooxygenase [Cellulophaga]|uniref:Antibiotic biosynthesis monooxygenase n=2 Tax=Cellulophaga TaxID=104264 RepID=F0REK1_CELLC|nr:MULTISPECIES: antibiotic biosynthesis monooxygenase family protein [Cellulophaga]ADY31016.1 Antibiotic biosynthesis monooxygenase [Cellulophaga lytica DSM 7489]AIM61981.1 antibiotic biosynthesis monooxygenase [Cellulophaga lytica]APU11889.1 antibiotic biosynthesis monooxygenase [Cellulophaga lytica]EWH13373.1 antibiotic biosynthesis monooxygenase [Cellulophaga geojensis KL-A]MDO6852893.1 antibiotic biosynthesis monooxygenase family protein [Cellulophaga lytica]
MIVRIVKLTFKTENIVSFENIFNQSKHLIRNFDGCNFLELYQDKNNPAIFFTYSYWDSENALEAYRHSDLFIGVWAKTKILFADKPEAWTVNKNETLN